MSELLVIMHGTDALLPGLGYTAALDAPGDMDRLDAELRGFVPTLTDWSYNMTDLSMHVPPATVVPEGLSKFGTVEVLDLGG